MKYSRETLLKLAKNRVSDGFVLEDGEAFPVAVPANDLVIILEKYAEALKVIEFYGNEKSWLHGSAQDSYSEIDNDSYVKNYGHPDAVFISGKRARAFLAKHESDESEKS